jgi:2-methylcitrate dehydratase PrpD
MDLAFTLAKNLVEVGYDRLPKTAVDTTRKDILDIMGTMVAGSKAPGVVELAEMVKDWAGKKESTVVAFDCRVPAPFAALVNGAMGHALDFDDGHDGAILHAATTVVPAAFAVAQRIGTVDGKSFITAVALGIDLTCRMGLASKKTLKECGWVYTAIYGYFGATAAAGKLLGLTTEKMVDALGIAYSQTAGNFQSIADAALTKRLQPGFAAKGGVFSALLAAKGVSGIRNIIEGEWGLYNVYHQGDYDPLALTDELGSRFEVANIGFKAYPSCGYTHSPIYATVELVTENDIQPEDVKEVIVYIGANASQLCKPLDRKRHPETVPDAQWSIPYTVATALVKRNVGIGDFTPEAIRNSAVLEIADKVTPKILSELTQREVEMAIIEITTTEGRVYTKKGEFRKGSINNPMTMKELTDKFKDCVSNGRKSFSRQTIDTVIEQAGNIEEMTNAGELIALLA